MEDSKVNWYVLFARTGTEERLAEQLNYEFTDEIGISFIPKKIAIYRRKGVKSRFEQKCFPGYVFIESAKPLEEILNRMTPIVYRQKNAYKFLHYGENKNDIAMHEEERIALSALFNAERIIDISKGYKEGDTVKIVSGALVNREGIIQRVNVSRKEVVIAVYMFGAITSLTVGLEMIE